mgnify:CR=1 FL=1
MVAAAVDEELVAIAVQEYLADKEQQEQLEDVVDINDDLLAQLQFSFG